jgi:hypothetical protein
MLLTRLAFLHGSGNVYGRSVCAVVTGPESAEGSTVNVQGHVIKLSRLAAAVTEEFSPNLQLDGCTHHYTMRNCHLRTSLIQTLLHKLHVVVILLQGDLKRSLELSPL